MDFTENREDARQERKKRTRAFAVRKTEESLRELLITAKKADPGYMDAAWERWDSLCKPLRSFGVLEEAVVRTAGIQRTRRPYIDRPVIVVMGADNGVTEEGVSQTGSEVTAQVMENMGAGLSAICILAQEIHAEVCPVNIGMLTEGKHERIINAPVRKGTGNIAKGPAMTREEAVRAIDTGIRLAEKMQRKGHNILLTGEMGIGNTTTSSAMAAVFLDLPPEKVTGYGAGLSEVGYKHKIEVIRQAIRVNQPDREDALDVLSKVGGLDLAGMTGLFLGGAIFHMPVLIDGFVSSVAAFCAWRLCEASRDYMFATHCSREPGAGLLLDAMDLHAFLRADMCMGEGTGAAAAYPVLRAGFEVYRQLPTFLGGKVKPYEHLR